MKFIESSNTQLLVISKQYCGFGNTYTNVYVARDCFWELIFLKNHQLHLAHGKTIYQWTFVQKPV